MDHAMTPMMPHHQRFSDASAATDGRSASGVWIPDAAIIEAERRRQQEIERRERPFLEVPRHPVLEEAPESNEPEPGGTVIILDI